MRTFSRGLSLLICGFAVVALVACQPIQPVSDTGVAPETAQAAPAQAESAQVAGAQDESAFAGDWDGVLNVAGMSMRIIVSLEQGADGWSGTADIPAQGAVDVPLHSFVVAYPSLQMQMLEGEGVASFNGVLGDDGQISGSFEQVGLEGDFNLHRPAAAVEVEVPYVVEDVTFEGDGATLAGTLTKPEGEGPFPAIILVSGSGPQNRNEELPLLVDYAPFREIADRLSQSGFAVLRYDDRGVGESTGDFAAATTTTFAEDAAAGIAYLRSLPEIDPAQVGILGHSEGAIVAAAVAASDPTLAYVVAWAGTAVSGADVVVVQGGLQMEKAGGLPEDVAAYREELGQALRFALEGDEKGLSDYLNTVIRAAYVQLSDEEKESLGFMEDAIAKQVNEQMVGLTSPWMLEFLAHNPADDWAHVTSPALLFFGELDTQVDVTQNREPMEAALRAAGNFDVTTYVLPKANHLFVEAETGAAAEYSSLQPQLIPEFLDLLTSWLMDHASFVQ